MRNLAQYPMTTADITRELEIAAAFYGDNPRPGSLAPLALRKAAEIIRALEEQPLSVRSRILPHDVVVPPSQE